MSRSITSFRTYYPQYPQKVGMINYTEMCGECIPNFMFLVAWELSCVVRKLYNCMKYVLMSFKLIMAYLCIYSFNYTRLTEI